MSLDITQVAQAFLTLMAALVTAVVVPWVRANTDEKQQDLLQTLLRIGVQAAEQLYGSGAGQEKKEYVLRYLAHKGIEVDDAALEATVMALFGKGE